MEKLSGMPPNTITSVIQFKDYRASAHRAVGSVLSAKYQMRMTKFLCWNRVYKVTETYGDAL